MFSLLLLSQHKGKFPQFPKHYDFHHNNNKQGLKASQLPKKKKKRGKKKKDGMKGEREISAQCNKC